MRASTLVNGDAGLTPAIEMRQASVRSTLDRSFWLVTALASLATLVGAGLLTAIIPNPIFGRPIAPEASALAVWIVSAPLMGALVATYLTRPRDARIRPDEDAGVRATTLGGIAVFFAIGCPICNKLVLVALGTSGALNLFAPVQPVIGLASVALLTGTLAWRLRRRALACPVAVASPASGPGDWDENGR